MALFDHASIAFSMTDVGYFDLARNEPTRRVHLLLTEYAKDQYVLLLCELAEGTLVCDDPPRVIRWVPIPHKQVNFTFETSSKRIGISVLTEWSFSIVFGDLVDYWEMVRIVAEVNTVEALNRRAIDDLVQGAIATIPTVRLRSPSLAGGDVLAASGEDMPAVQDAAAQTAANGLVASSEDDST
uniref:Carboxylic ester hydrolase (EC) n=1 Tax=Ganoderma boninense TaxID=34458 RepID=A0A5K1K757_9APHY|nr:Carboxylic ester hydrolase (EC [Ganoderma boninense]